MWNEGYRGAMLKGQDVVLLLRLIGDPHVGSTQRLADATGLSPATVHRALHRLANAGLYNRQRRRVPEAAAEEFLVHAVKYLFPAVRGSETRGVAAAWAAPPLLSEIADDAPSAGVAASIRETQRDRAEAAALHRARPGAGRR